MSLLVLGCTIACKVIVYEQVDSHSNHWRWAGWPRNELSPEATGIEHIVLERSRVAEGWRTERWDSLVFQFPNWSIKLPGHVYTTGNPDGFAPKDEIVTFLEGYADAIQAPLQCGVNAQALQHDAATGHFVIGTSIGYIRALNIVSATGSYHQDWMITGGGHLLVL